MDAIERAQKCADKREKRARHYQYRLLRKVRKARDIASKHLTKQYPVTQLIVRMKLNNTVDWMESSTKDELALDMYKWAKKFE